MHQLPDIEIPGVTFERFLGSGASSTVWLARTGANREVAVKIFLNPQNPSAAFDEAGALARLRHPNIIRIHSVHAGGGFIAIVMDLAAATLAQVVQASNGLRGAQVVGLVSDLCAGIAQLHATGLAHGDISPANIGFTLDGVAQLLDFGAVHDDLVLGTAGFSFTTGGPVRLAGESEHELVPERSGLADAEQRVRRLLGGAPASDEPRVNEPVHGESRQGVAVTPEEDRRLRDLIAIARVGLYSLGVRPESGNLEDLRGGVAKTVAQKLQSHLELFLQGGTREADPRALAEDLARVIPRAPIPIKFGDHRLPGESAAGAAVPMPTTERARTVGGEWNSGAHSAPSPVSAPDEGQVSGGTRARALLAVLAAFTGIAVIGVGIVIGMEQEEGPQLGDSSRNTVGSLELPKDASDLEHWQLVLDELASARDAVFKSGKFDELASVNVPNSPADHADAALIARLDSGGLEVAQFLTESTVRRVREIGAQRVKLDVETRVVEQQIRRSEVAIDSPNGGGQTPELSTELESAIEIELRSDGVQWRVYGITRV